MAVFQEPDGDAEAQVGRIHIVTEFNTFLDVEMESLDAIVVKMGNELVRLDRLQFEDFKDLQPYFEATGSTSRVYECNLIDLLLRPLHVFFTERNGIVLVFISPHNQAIRKERAGFLPPLFQGDPEKASIAIAEVMKTLLHNPGFRFVALSQDYLEATGISKDGEMSFVRQEGNCEDFVYLRDELLTLSGSKAQKEKRRQANNFERDNHPLVEKLASKHIPGCMVVCESYRNEKGGDEADPNVLRELRFTLNLLHQFEHITSTIRGCQLRGIVVSVAGKVVAFSIADSLGRDAIVIHVEKALAAYKGAYQYVNRETVRILSEDHIKYVNRECARKGADGLRQTKMAYRPHCMIMKYAAYLAKTSVACT